MKDIVYRKRALTPSNPCLTYNGTFHIIPELLMFVLLVYGLYKEDYLQFFLNVSPFDYTAFSVSGKVRIP